MIYGNSSRENAPVAIGLSWLERRVASNGPRKEVVLQTVLQLSVSKKH